MKSCVNGAKAHDRVERLHESRIFCGTLVMRNREYKTTTKLALSIIDQVRNGLLFLPRVAWSIVRYIFDFERVLHVLFFLLPPAVFSVVAYTAVVVFTPNLLPLWIAIPLGILAGLLCVFICIAPGSDIIDVIIKSAIMLILALTFLPVFARARENARRSRMKNSVPSQMYRTHLSNADQGRRKQALLEAS